MSWSNRHRMHKHSATKVFSRSDIPSLEDSVLLVDTSGGAVVLTLPEMNTKLDSKKAIRTELGGTEDGFRIRIRRSGANTVTVTAHANNKMDLGALGSTNVLASDGDVGVYAFMESENSWIKIN